MKIVSYNVNGIRAAIRKGFWEWLGQNDFDIVCLQETKAVREQLTEEDFTALADLGYTDHWFSAEKRGYSGVATFSRTAPQQVLTGCDHPEFDTEGRVIRTDFEDFTLLNIYFPSGTTGGPRQELKYRFLDHVYDWIHELRKTQPEIIVVGDYNIAHTENDIHNPKSNKNSSGFLPEERAWMTKWFDSGFHDSFRLVHPEKTEYSWWSYRANARANNKGWRIDYQSVTDGLKSRVQEVQHLKEAIHSDHCAVVLELR